MVERIGNILALLFIGICFFFAASRIVSSAWKNREVDGERPVTLRFAHWQLESGVREALDEIAAEYMKKNPGVRVVQVAIPEKIFRNWLVTQLVGGTAPDIIELGKGLTDEMRARYFFPLTEIANLPNPHNTGTELEDVPLRETYFDGLESGFSQTLFAYYGLPLSGFTNRVFFNLELLNEITGGGKLPQTYDELIALCDEVDAYSRRTGKSIIPIAGSRYNAPILVSYLFGGQTQKLVDRINPLGSIPWSMPKVAEAYGREWTLESPEIVAGAEIMRDVGRHMQTGFLQLQRDDATFYFVQKRALMIVSGSWDASSINSQAPFPIGVCKIPMPVPGEGKFGKFTKGRVSEAGQQASVLFGVSRTSSHSKEALDFLLFMASKPMNQVFARRSGWTPSVVGVEPGELARQFVPQAEGTMQGFSLLVSDAPDLSRLVNNEMHRLFRLDGSAEDFLAAIKPGYGAALLSDLKRSNRNLGATNQRLDTVLGAQAVLAARDDADEAVRGRFLLLLESVTNADRILAFNRLMERRMSKTSSSHAGKN